MKTPVKDLVIFTINLKATLFFVGNYSEGEAVFQKLSTLSKTQTTAFPGKN